MKIVHLITRLIVGGAQENTVLTAIDHAEEFSDRVTLLTGPGLGPEGSLESQVKRSPVELVILPELRRALNPWRDWQSDRAIRRELRRLKPDILHTHSSKAGILGRAAARALGVPVVHTIHGAAFHYGQSSIARKLYTVAERWAGRRTDRFISVCDAMSEQYLRAGIGRAADYITIRSGMDVEPFLHPPRDPASVRADFDLKPTDLVIAKIARMFPLKGHAELLRSLGPVFEANPNVRVLLVGDGILRSDLEAEIERWGWTSNFRFTGLVPPDRVPELIHAADIVAHTSGWEGLARVLPQGLIAGKPVVSFAIDGAPEVVIDGETGFLVERGDHEGLTTALMMLIDDPDLRTRLGQTGRERFTEPFRHQTASRQIRKVYESVLAEKS